MKARGFDVENQNKSALPKLRVGDVLFAAPIIAAFLILVLI
jgi:hypothetical protein